MSENKYEPPKKLRHGVYPFDVMTEYVRADLVDGLVKALERWFSSLSDWDQLEDEVKAALAALKEEG
jgi:hypothetical protein